MDRNTIFGLLALVGFVIIWAVFFGSPETNKRPQKQPVVQNDSSGNDTSGAKQQPDTTRAADAQPDEQLTAETQTAAKDSATAQLSDSARTALALQNQFGPFAKLADGEAQMVTVETDAATFQLSTKGGSFHSAVLNAYKTYNGEPLDLWPASQKRKMNYTFIHRELEGDASHRIETQKLYFEPVGDVKALSVSGEDSKTLKLRAQLSQGHYIEHRYTFYGDRYHVDHQLVFVGMGNYLSDRSVNFSAMLDVPQTEKSRESMLQKTSVYYSSDDDVDDLGPGSGDPEEEQLELGAKWLSFKMQFFDLFFIADKTFENVKVSAKPIPQSRGVRRLAFTSDYAISGGPQDVISTKLYFGPAEYNTLASYDLGMAKTIDMGWGPIRWITIGIQTVFRGLENFISNYGIIILILAIGVKAMLWPLTQKMLKGQAKMQVVNKLPEIKELEEEHKDDAQKLQQAKMKIYTKLGVSPFSGCLPMLLQFPVLIAMFVFFPNSIELRQEGFLWANDLSTYDAFIEFNTNIWLIGDHLSLFTMLWVASQLMYTIIQQKTGQMQMGGGQQAKLMKYFPYIMPLIFFTIFNSYSSGLSYYYLVFNLITISQTFFIKYVLIDHKKLEKQIDDVRSGKAPPKKKGGIAGWMARQQEKQQELMEARKADMHGRSGRRQHQQNQKKKKKRRK